MKLINFLNGKLKNKFTRVIVLFIFAVVFAMANTKHGGLGLMLPFIGLVAGEGGEGGAAAGSESSLKELESIKIPQITNAAELVKFIKETSVESLREMTNAFSKQVLEKIPAGAGGGIRADLDDFGELNKLFVGPELTIKNSKERRRVLMNKIIRGTILPDKYDKDHKVAEIMNAVTAVQEAVGGDQSLGGILLPAPMAQTIVSNLAEYNFATTELTQLPIPSRTFKVPRLLANASGAWVGEKDVKPLGAPTMDDVVFTAHKYALILPFTDDILQDTQMDLEALCLMFILQDFDRARDAALFNGAVTADGTIYGLGTLVGMAEEVINGPHFADILYDNIINMTTGIQAQNLPGAKFVMHRTIWGILCKLKNAMGQYVIDAMDRKSKTLEGYPVILNEAAIAKTADAISKRFIFFGNYKRMIRGYVNNILMSRSNEASLYDAANQTTINLWQQNMYALRIEERYDYETFFPTAIIAAKTAAA